MYTESSFEQLDALTPEPFAQVAAPPENPLPELPASLKVVSDYFEINYDTLRNKWIGKVEACYEGLNCPPIRDKSKRVTAFGFEAIREFLECKTDKDYQSKLRSRYGDKSQAEQPVTSPKAKGGLMNLPSLSPVTSIVPQNQPLPTDDNPAQALATRSNQLLPRAWQKLIAKKLLKQRLYLSQTATLRTLKKPLQRQSGKPRKFRIWLLN
jgi:hypothetical protein